MDLAANLETFALILQDTEKNLFDGLKRTAADNTLQITLDLEMRSQLTNYIEAQRRVLGINFLGVYDGKSGAIAFSGGEQNAGLKEWRLSFGWRNGHQRLCRRAGRRAATRHVQQHGLPGVGRAGAQG